MFKTKIKREWYVVIAGLADWQSNAKKIPMGEFQEIKEIINNFMSKTYKQFRSRGALAGSLLWSHENLAPMFLLEKTRANERFLKEQRVVFGTVSDKILSGLTHEERQSNIGINIQNLNLEGKLLMLDCTIPSDSSLYPDDLDVAKVFSDAFNAELLTIMRAEHDFSGRKNWLASLDSVLSRETISETGPVKKLREIKEIEAKRLYEKRTPGDFEKIVRYLSEAVPYRYSLFELEKPVTSYVATDLLGHILIFYLSTGGDFPMKLSNRSVLFERPGRKLEMSNWIESSGINWKDLDKLMVYLEQIAYDQIEKVITDVGGIKLDGLWTERDISDSVYFLSQFSFTEDVMKQLKQFIINPREQIERQVGHGLSQLFDIWQKAELSFNFLVFEVRAFDNDEEKKLIDWVKSHKAGKIPGPNYGSEKEIIEENHYRPF
jgi:hypothetical protein